MPHTKQYPAAATGGRGPAGVDGTAEEPPEEHHWPAQPSEGQNGDNWAPNPDNIFAFTVADLPYVPDPTQPRLQAQDCVLPPCPSSDLDALIGTADPLDFTRIGRPAQGVSPQGYGDGTGVGAPSFDPTLGFSTEPLLTPSPSYTQGSHEEVNWTMGDTFHANTAFTAGGGGIVGEDRNAQREALLGAVGRLVQLASLMQ